MKNSFEGVWNELESKKWFPERISYKISETNPSFHVKQHTTGKVESLFFGTFLLELTKFLLWQGDWALDHHSVKFRHLLIFPNFLSS